LPRVLKRVKKTVCRFLSLQVFLAPCGRGQKILQGDGHMGLIRFSAQVAEAGLKVKGCGP